MAVIGKGQRNVEVLKQGVNSPMSVEDQVVIIYCGTKNLMRKVPVEKVKEFETDLISYMRNKHSAELESLRTGKLTDEATQAIEKAAEELSAKYA